MNRRKCLGYLLSWRCEGQICSELITLTIKLKINANFIKNTFAKVKNFFAPATMAYTFA